MKNNKRAHFSGAVKAVVYKIRLHTWKTSYVCHFISPKKPIKTHFFCLQCNTITEIASQTVTGANIEMYRAT